MRLEVREMRPEERQDVEVILLDENTVGAIPVGESVEGGIDLTSKSTLSLVACLNELIVGGILCNRTDACGYVYHLPLGNELAQRWVVKSLIDKALRRLHAVGIKKCRICLISNHENATSDWGYLKWRSRSDFSGTPIPSTGAIDQIKTQFGGGSSHIDEHEVAEEATPPTEHEIATDFRFDR